MTTTDDRVSVWVFGTILVAAALLLSPFAVTALPDDPLSGTGTDTTNTTNTTLDTNTATLTSTPTTTLSPPITTTLEPTDSTDVTTSTDTLTDEASAPTPTPTETIGDVESTVEDAATDELTNASESVTETADTLTDVSTESTDTLAGTVETTTTVTVPLDSTATADLTATPSTETTVGDTSVTTDTSVDTTTSNVTNTATETLETDATTTVGEAVATETAKTTDSVLKTTTETMAHETQTDADDATSAATSDPPVTTTSNRGDSTDGTADEAVTDSTAVGQARSGQGAVGSAEPTTADDDNATALLPPLSTVPEPVSEETGIVLGFGALVTAGAVRYGPAFDWSSFSHVANHVTSPAASGRLHAGIERVTHIIAPFRYSRFDDSDPLEHEGRDAVFSAISESPGIYLSAVADHADVPLSTARHHLRVLEDEKLISGAKIRGKRRFYATHTEGQELVAALNDEPTAAVLDALSRLGPSSVSALAADLGRDPSTITHHLQRLEADDIVVREREGRAVVTRLSTEAKAALRPEPEPVPSTRVMADGSGVKEGLGQ